MGKRYVLLRLDASSAQMDRVEEIAWFASAAQAQEYLQQRRDIYRNEIRNWGGTFYQVFKRVEQETTLSFSRYEPLEGERPIGYMMAGVPRPQIIRLQTGSVPVVLPTE